MKNILVILFVLCYVQSQNVVVGPGVEEIIATQGSADIVVTLETLNFDNFFNGRVEPTSALETTTNVIDEMIRLLKNDRDVKQPPVLDKLKQNALDTKNCRRYYVANSMACDKVTKTQLESLKADKLVRAVILNKPAGNVSLGQKPAPVDLQPQHITEIAADKLWKVGKTKGKNIVIGIASTGVNVEHEALKPSYRGTNRNGTFNHNYNWFDAYAGNPVPRDSVFVGTHVAGVAAGTKNKIGVAPESKFIACKIIDDLGRDTPEAYIKCLQWFLAPTDTSGNNGKSNRRPHVVYIPYSESSFGDVFFAPIGILRAAGIYVITQTAPTEAGNIYCARQIRAPAAYTNVLTVSALDLNNTRLPTSTGGPVFYPNGTIDRTRVKPDIVAPGQSVVSSVYFNGQNLYLAASGSVVASTVTVGAVALLWSAIPRLRRSVALTDEILRRSAVRMLSLDCLSLSNYPNNLYGYGKLNILNAYKQTCKISRNLCRKCRWIKLRKDRLECKRNYCLRYPSRRNHWRYSNVEEVEAENTEEEVDNTLEEIIETYE